MHFHLNLQSHREWFGECNDPPRTPRQAELTQLGEQFLASAQTLAEQSEVHRATWGFCWEKPMLC